jgi:hypothetical protein
VTKDNFVEVYSKAHVKGMTHENILAVFKKTSLHPFNPNVVTDAMLAPSLETSTSMASAFSITQPGPVDTMLKAMQQVNMPLQCVVQDHNLQQTQPTTPQLSRTNPLTPQSRNIDPCLLSPVTEHARLVTNNLHKDGYAFLIPGNDSFSSQTSIPDLITTYLPKAPIDSTLLEPISAGSYRSRDYLEKENIAL